MAVEKEAKAQHDLDRPVVVEVGGPLMDEQVVRRTCHPSYRPHTPAGQELELVQWVEAVVQHELGEHEEVLGSCPLRPRIVLEQVRGREQVEEQHEERRSKLWLVVGVGLAVEEGPHEGQGLR